MKNLSTFMATLFIIVLTLPTSSFAGRDGSSDENGKPDNNKTHSITTTAENISHSIGIHIVFVGYDHNVVDTALVDANIQRYYELPYWDTWLQYALTTDYAFADESYRESLKEFILQNSVSGTGTTSALNVTALQYQKEAQTPMSIFLPQSGVAIDARALEQWFADNPYCDESGYTFYVLNFTEFDSLDHSWEHWYNITRLDLEANSVNDFWRLEWDNPLNPDVRFPYPAYTSDHRLVFIDPSAFQWYLTWARIWWGLDDYLVGPKYAYYYQDLDDFVATQNLSATEGKDALAQYLAGWIDDFLYNMVSPVAWPTTANSLSLQILVLNNVSQHGYTNENMQWILNVTLVEEAIRKLAPFMKVQVTTRFENLSSYAEIEGLLEASFLEERGGWRYYDGYGLFYALQETRDRYFNMKAADLTVNAYVILLKNASFETALGGTEYTGLGGMQQVLVLKSIDRYFREDGLTPKSGLGMVMIHELGHNMFFPHTFGPMQHAGDFSEDVMGYYSYFYRFCKMRTDMFRRILVDLKLSELKRALGKDVSSNWIWHRKTLFLKNYLLNAIHSKIELALEEYDQMNYLMSYYATVQAEKLQAYLREILDGVRVPGDIDCDGKCHIADYLALHRAYGSTPSSPNWNPNADLNKDGIVNFKDCRILKCFFGKKAKITAGFVNWKTGTTTTTIDVGAYIYPEWYMPYTESNVTYGFTNWDDKRHSCLVRISDVTLSHLVEYVTVRIYNETATVAELTWTTDTAMPSDWMKLTVDPQSRYSISIELQGTVEAYFEMTVITLECRQIAPSCSHR